IRALGICTRTGTCTATGRGVTCDDVRIQLGSGQLGEVDLGLLRHLRERLVVEHAVDLVDGRAALGREVLPRTGERIEVGGYGQGPVDDGRGRIVRSPEVVDI